MAGVPVSIGACCSLQRTDWDRALFIIIIKTRPPCALGPVVTEKGRHDTTEGYEDAGGLGLHSKNAAIFFIYKKSPKPRVLRTRHARVY